MSALSRTAWLLSHADGAAVWVSLRGGGKATGPKPLVAGAVVFGGGDSGGKRQEKTIQPFLSA